MECSWWKTGNWGCQRGEWRYNTATRRIKLYLHRRVKLYVFDVPKLRKLGWLGPIGFTLDDGPSLNKPSKSFASTSPSRSMKPHRFQYYHNMYCYVVIAYCFTTRVQFQNWLNLMAQLVNVENKTQIKYNWNYYNIYLKWFVNLKQAPSGVIFRFF